MTRKQIRIFLKEQFFTKPRGKWNVIYSVWRGFIIAWWNTLLIWAAGASNQLVILVFIYLMMIAVGIFIYAISKGR